MWFRKAWVSPHSLFPRPSINPLLVEQPDRERMRASCILLLSASVCRGTKATVRPAMRLMSVRSLMVLVLGARTVVYARIWYGSAWLAPLRHEVASIRMIFHLRPGSASQLHAEHDVPCLEWMRRSLALRAPERLNTQGAAGLGLQSGPIPSPIWKGQSRLGSVLLGNNGPKSGWMTA